MPAISVISTMDAVHVLLLVHAMTHNNVSSRGTELKLAVVRSHRINVSTAASYSFSEREMGREMGM